MYTSRKKTFPVKITDADRDAVRRIQPNASLMTIDRHAIARAAARQVLVETRSTADALDCLTASIPKDTLHSWMKARLMAA